MLYPTGGAPAPLCRTKAASLVHLAEMTTWCPCIQQAAVTPRHEHLPRSANTVCVAALGVARFPQRHALAFNSATLLYRGR
jgi:hypothetical protein